MFDTMNELERFSEFGGTLIEEIVRGDANQLITAENTVVTEAGKDRTMFSYIPKSGCPDAKQCQVLMVLRNDSTQESAEALLEELGLRELAEQRNFILLFPNPEGSWNYTQDPNREDDISYLVRCFTCLPKSKGTVAGFNGMIFYIGVTPEASALLATMSAISPINCSAIMVGHFPDGYELPSEDLKQEQNAWVYGDNTAYVQHLTEVNHATKVEDSPLQYRNDKNPNVRFFATRNALSKAEIFEAWERLFSETRRWRNDTYGTYQRRTNFTERGFIPHVKDTSLGVNDGFAHTWYEYVPQSVRNSDKKVPLVFYFHGGNCIPLYGAEQSGYHDIADKEEFIVVYPKASTMKRWNVWDDADAGISDFAFVLALIEHMKATWPIDETRIYASGFSMGSMMTNALCSAYPEIFAAGAAFNAQHFGYFATLESTMSRIRKPSDLATLTTFSHCHELADEKKAAFDYRMPLIQFSGLLDGLAGQGWPVTSEDVAWIQTINYWKAYNHIPVTPFVQSSYESGLLGERNEYDCADERFLHHYWYDEDHNSLYQMVVAKRMPHAVDLREVEIAWNFIKNFSRRPDGTLEIKQAGGNE